MKKVIFTLSLISLFVAVSTAQVVQIPDTAFLNYLTTEIVADTSGDHIPDVGADFNNDGLIQLNEAQAIVYINIFNLNIRDVDCINKFSRLNALYISSTSIQAIDFTGLDSLRFCDVKYNSELRSVSVSGSFGSLAHFHFTGNWQLAMVDLRGLQFHSAAVIDLEENGIETLYLKNGISENTIFQRNPIRYVCCDSLELWLVEPQVNSTIQLGYSSNCTIDTTCSSLSSVLYGNIGRDNNFDCLSDSLPLKLSWIPVIAENAFTTVQTLTDQNGEFKFRLDTGEYSIRIMSPNDYYLVCDDIFQTTLLPLPDTNRLEFLYQPVIDCPLLEVNIVNSVMRRCFSNKYIVQYCNTGPAAAPNAQVTVTLSDDVAFLGSSIPAVHLGGTMWSFDLDTVASEDCGSFTIDFEVLCDSTVLGQTICATAHITPDSICTDSTWSGAEVREDGHCEGDSVRFVIRNVGSGNMSDNVDFIVIEDMVIFMQGNFNLPSGDSLVIKVPANGSTYRLQAEQEPTFPFHNMPAASVEGCGQNLDGQFSLGFVSQFHEDDGNPFFSTDCSTVVGSYDPNDKAAIPTGVGAPHYIEPETPITYTIRFQNTGTDTAFNVVIRDTLSPWLSVESLTGLISDHNYEVAIENGNELVFTFANIMLPDSNVNEALSHGFIRFQMTPKTNTPLGTLLENSAAIYFDFNDPIITNTVFHTVDTGFLDVKTVSLFEEKNIAETQLYPNPVRAGDVLFFENALLSSGRVIFTNPLGKTAFQSTLQGKMLRLPSDLPTGVYVVQCVFADGARRFGRVVVE